MDLHDVPLYDAARMFNIVVGTLVIALVARAWYRSRRYLAPSEKLMLMVIGGYATGAVGGSWIALHIGAPANAIQFWLMAVQVWAVVGLAISRRRTERLTPR